MKIIKYTAAPVGKMSIRCTINNGTDIIHVQTTGNVEYRILSEILNSLSHGKILYPSIISPEPKHISPKDWKYVKESPDPVGVES